MVTPLRIIPIGTRYGRLTVVGAPFKPEGARDYFVACACDCGERKAVRPSDLRSGDTRSCGCLRKETAGRMNLTHGHSGKNQTPAYRSWASMVRRCTYPSDIGYQNYGGRGISICQKWRTFEGFHEDMGDPPVPGLSLERNDVNGDYCKANCRWASKLEQANNTRTNRLLTLQGRTQTVAQWGRETGMRPSTIHARLVSGWPVEEALSKPVRFNRRFHSARSPPSP